jgi:SPP1 family predicted phage head-tail adaptor
MIRSGALRHYIAAQQPSGSRDAVGERVTNWTTVAYVYAQVDPLSTAERFVAEQIHSSVTHRITIRGDNSELSAFDTSWRFLYGDRIFTIDGIRNIDEKNSKIECVCTEGLRGE